MRINGISVWEVSVVVWPVAPLAGTAVSDPVDPATSLGRGPLVWRLFTSCSSPPLKTVYPQLVLNLLVPVSYIVFNACTKLKSAFYNLKLITRLLNLLEISNASGVLKPTKFTVINNQTPTNNFN